MKKYIPSSIVILVISVLLIIFLATGFWQRFFYPEEDEVIRTRVVTPSETGSFYVEDHDGFSRFDNINTKIPLDDEEIVIATVNKESEDGRAEEQFAVYRKASDIGPIYLTYFSYDENTRSYRRMWDMPTAATRAETITLFNQDLIGDRNNCIIVTGMNAQNEHTMTIFRRTPGLPLQSAYRKIAELQIAGSIVIQETGRTLAYQQGVARGTSHNIASYGQDPMSSNFLDQIETIYRFNPSSGQYERSSVSRIPGSQIEQRRLRELLSGARGVFENFIHGLWYYVSPEGTIDTKQYLYFDPVGKEIIFYGDEAQQVFQWQTSTPTRYGIYIRSQNISISTLLRFVDIGLESLDRLNIRVIEDVRLKITVSTTWDGSYRRATMSPSNGQNAPIIKEPINALYDSSWGRFQFLPTGEYTINLAGTIRKGHYVFYNIDRNELLELRPADNTSESRMIYRLENAAGVTILSRVRLGTTGIQDLMEPPVTLTKVIN
ncbi:MAG: pallilysin-related adhesin [Treponema sp.]|nr:pallilysin-related adhesin [Treponema sp.]